MVGVAFICCAFVAKIKCHKIDTFECPIVIPIFSCFNSTASECIKTANAVGESF